MRTKEEILNQVTATFNIDGKIIEEKLYGEKLIFAEILLDIRDLLANDNEGV